MKISKLLIAALIASATLISSAQATTVPVVKVSPTFPDGSVTTIATKTLNYSSTGKLAADTKVVFTLTSTGTAPGSLTSSGNFNSLTNNGAGATSTGGLVTGSNTSSLLPIIAVSNLGNNSSTATITFTNLSRITQSFAAYFSAILGSAKGTFTVAYAVSAVPLPSALVLFASALILLAGLRMKKARNQA